MIVRLLGFVLRFKTVIWALVAAAVAASAFMLTRAPLDAIPDISDPQVVVYVKWPRSPQLLESNVNEPIIRALVGAPGVQSIRGTSHMGYSFIYVILENGANRARVRDLVNTRVNALRPQLPADALVSLGPNASSMGWVYQYALVDREGVRDLRELRLLNESQVKPALQAVSGIAEVASVGGLEKQYQVKLFPPLLASFGLSLRNVVDALGTAYQEVGGRTIEVTNREYQLRAVLDSGDIEQLEHLILGRDPEGRPIALKDVGYVQVGYDLRRSTADLDGAGEVVGGIVVMEQDQNVLAITRSLNQRLAMLRSSLPKGVEIVTTYDRAAWIWATLKQFIGTLLSELVVLILVTVLFLGNFRSAVGPIAILLLSTLFTVLPLAGFGQTINLFSLAGLCIAIGAIEDATIVIVENCVSELALQPLVRGRARRPIILHSIARVARPLLYSLVIIVASFLPVFFLEDREARLFDPLAYSKTFAMAFSTLLTLLLLPLIVLWIFKREQIARRNFQESVAVRAYRGALTTVIRYRYVFTIAGLLTLIPGAIVLSSFPKDFLPNVDEGAVLYMPTTLPGLPNREAGWVVQQMDKKLKAFPEVASVFGKIGRADTSTDPAPLTMIETTVLLKPRSQWRNGMTSDKLVAEMDRVGFGRATILPIAIGLPFGDDSSERWLDAIERSPARDRLVPFASVHPHWAGWREHLSFAAARGARGIKVHPEFQRLFPDETSMMEVYEECDRLGDLRRRRREAVGAHRRLGRVASPARHPPRRRDRENEDSGDGSGTASPHAPDR